ncbi:MAG: glycosyltransferase N-terminal domain-containing protein [Pseudomonadota bacterium]
MDTIKTKNAFILNFLKLYNLLWWLCLPFLKKHRRLKPGFKRRVSTHHLSKADIWIQAASAGEAYLAVNIIKKLHFKTLTQVLVTTITSQGMDILKQNLENRKTGYDADQQLKLQIEWFPFDSPKIMKKAVKQINPKLMVLLETELWPALLYYLTMNQTKTMIVNARLSHSSFKHYRQTRFLWKHLAPDHILATSTQDKNRYARIFETSLVQTMPNIKFEAFDNKALDTDVRRKIKKILPDHLPLTILASVRKEEETIIFKMVQTLLNEFPDQVVAIFPRHMHRIKAWTKMLARGQHHFETRSTLTSLLKGPGIILWDTFGELKTAYGLARVVFVGGSLKPLGGQNFIEPAMQGATTIIGPYYDDFVWVTEQIFSQNIVIKKQTQAAVCTAILSALKNPVPRSDQIKRCSDFIHSKRGGTAHACQEIKKVFDRPL